MTSTMVELEQVEGGKVYIRSSAIVGIRPVQGITIVDYIAADQYLVVRVTASVEDVRQQMQEG